MRSCPFSHIFIQSIFALQVCAASLLNLQEPTLPLTSSQIGTFTPFSHFAAAAYCQPSLIRAWNCGCNAHSSYITTSLLNAATFIAKCEANLDFIPYAAGGDGLSVQFWFVGFSPTQQSVIVSHQGTDFRRVESLLTDLNIFFTRLNPDIFPRIPAGIQVHSGFANVHARSAKEILAAVQKVISRHKAKRVTIIGHSLGGALALLDGVFLPLHISGVSFRTITYGLPRVGNQAFANYVDTHVNLTHINNKMDPIPLLPPRLLGYHHASGEIHITQDNSWFSCPGQDNENPRCSAGGFAGNLNDHYGPYNGVIMKAGECQGRR